jgi:uncharacterized protein YkwD
MICGISMHVAIARAVAAFAGTLMLIVATQAAQAQEAGDAEQFRALALKLVNQARAEAKLPPLAIGKEINEAAKFHAADMLRRNFYAHESPEGKTVQDRYLKAGGSRWRITAENIARCEGGCTLTTKTVEELQRGWMNSKGHRENILRQGVSEFGFSMVAAPGKPLYAVQTFTGPGVPNGLQAGEQPKRLGDTQLTAKALELLNRTRKQAGRPAFAENPSLTKAVRALLPKKGLQNFELSQLGKLSDALPSAERERWQSLAILAGACGGCGAESTDIDVRAFLQQWMGDTRNEDMILNAASTHLGFALAASGEGKKVALLVLGKKQPK